LEHLAYAQEIMRLVERTRREGALGRNQTPQAQDEHDAAK